MIPTLIVTFFGVMLVVLGLSISPHICSGFLLSPVIHDTVFVHDTTIIDSGTVMRLSREKRAMLSRWIEIDDSLKLLTRDPF